MNFLDTYDISDPATTRESDTSGPEPTLNEEVSQVVGQLGRLWGGFRKQVRLALSSAYSSELSSASWLVAHVEPDCL